MSEERFCYSVEDMKAIDEVWFEKICSKVSCEECPLHESDASCFTDNAYYATAKAMEVLE